MNFNAATAVLGCLFGAAAAIAGEPLLMPLGDGWASNSINTTTFRTDPITTHGQQQFAAYYDADGRVVIATRTIGQVQWKTTVTALRGNTRDAHNGISMIADGEGILHISWDHHGHPLRYVRSKSADAPLEFTANLPMSGRNEKTVTYPQFFRLPDGNLVFLYRDGASGNGSLVVNHYDASRREWSQLHSNLISGQGQRNPYPQVCVDGRGWLHVSWVWRESPDVATNHDICYARSEDGGRTWKKSDGTSYAIPITAATAEIACPVPQNRGLMNQTSMCADGDGRPIIATFFQPDGQPKGRESIEYMIVHHDGSRWAAEQVSHRGEAFALSGAGSKRLPISRPQVLARTTAGKTAVWMIFRDAQRGGRASVAHCDDLSAAAPPETKWSVQDLTDFSLRQWEPSYDHVRWQRDGVLDLFVQSTGQGDGETLEPGQPQRCSVLELRP